MEKNAAKNRWFFGFPLVLPQPRHKKTHNESIPRLSSLPLTWRAGGSGGPTDSGDHQIAHVPPTAARAGAPLWAAKHIFTTINQRTSARNAGAAAIRGRKRFVVRRFAPFWVSRGTRPRFPAHPSRAGSLETCGFKQHFWSLLVMRPKVTRARGRGTLPSEKMNGPLRTPAPTKCITGAAAKCHGRGRTPPMQNANIPPRAQQKRDGRCRVRLFLSHLLSTPASPPDTPSAR